MLGLVPLVDGPQIQDSLRTPAFETLRSGIPSLTFTGINISNHYMLDISISVPRPLASTRSATVPLMSTHTNPSHPHRDSAYVHMLRCAQLLRIEEQLLLKQKAARSSTLSTLSM